MRLLVLSDLHHELWRKHAPAIDPAGSRPDIVILAGDIDNGTAAVAWAAATFPATPVLYVHGNHEADGQILEEATAAIAEACRRTEQVRLLDCSEYRHGNFRFLGTTLWTDFLLFGEAARQEAMRESEALLSDYKRIRMPDGQLLRATDTAQLHAEQAAWLRQALAEPFAGQTVVITHMAPSMRSVPEKFSTSLASAAFASPLDDLVAQADLWVHGHTHDSFDYTIGKCRVVCNPCGYMTHGGGTENALFDPLRIIELKDA